MGKMTKIHVQRRDHIKHAKDKETVIQRLWWTGTPYDDKKLGCLSIHTNIAEFRYKAAEFSDTKEMHVQTKRER